MKYLVRYWTGSTCNEEVFDDLLDAEQRRCELFANDFGLVQVRVVVECCGALLVLDQFTTTCPECGADYNMNGDRLAPREQWGCETGESWQDCY